MICPACKNDMIVVERNRIELDHCVNCGGTWFDSGELELLLGSLGMQDSRAFIVDLLSHPDPKTTEHTRKCPICADKLKKTTIGANGLLLDVCRQGDGIWFDGGEIDEVLTHVSSGPLAGEASAKKVSDFIGDVFKARKPGKRD